MLDDIGAYAEGVSSDECVLSDAEASVALPCSYKCVSGDRLGDYEWRST